MRFHFVFQYSFAEPTAFDWTAPFSSIAARYPLTNIRLSFVSAAIFVMVAPPFFANNASILFIASPLTTLLTAQLIDLNSLW